MRKVLIRFSTALLVVLMFVCMIVGVAYAATTTTTIGTFNVVESGGNIYIKYPFFLSVNNAGFAATGDISLTGLDTRVTSSGVPVPHMLTTDKTLFIGAVNPSTTTKFKYTAGNVNLSAFNIIVGEGGYITTPDNANLEPHDSFVLEMSVYLANTGVVFEKQDCLKLDYNASTEVLTLTVGNEGTPDYTLTATDVEVGLHTIEIGVEALSSSTFTEILRPTGNGSVTDEDVSQVPSSGSFYDKVDDVIADHDTTYLEGSNYAGAGSWNQTFTHGGYSISSTINSIKVCILGLATSSGGGFYASPILYIDGVSYHVPNPTGPDFRLGVQVWTLREYTWDTNPATGVDWTVDDINNLEFGIAFRVGQSLGEAHMTQCYAEVSCDVPYGAYLTLYVDDVLADSEELTSVIPDTANDWEWFANPYFEYIVLQTAN